MYEVNEKTFVIINQLMVFSLTVAKKKLVKLVAMQQRKKKIIICRRNHS
jgi:hypothetical protein